MERSLRTSRTTVTTITSIVPSVADSDEEVRAVSMTLAREGVRGYVLARFERLVLGSIETDLRK